MNRRLGFAASCAAAALCTAWGSSVFADVIVNEVHYRPARAATQFVELFNTGSTAVELSGWSLASSVRARFPEGTTIAPGGYVVIAADPSFLREHGPSIPATVPVLGWDGGDLGGGRVQLLAGQASVMDDVDFASDARRPSKSNGGGSSLELVNPRLENGSPRAWRASAVAHGTPGAANSTLGEPVVVSESPARGASAVGMREISVTFSEELKGVKASDLTVNGIAAGAVSGSGAGPYTFAVLPLVPGEVNVALRGNVIEAADGHAFGGDAWQYLSPTASTLSMPDNATGGLGANVQVPISVEPGAGIFGIDMTLQYDAAVVSAQNVTVSGVAASAGFALVRNLNTPGTIIISTYATGGPLPSGGEIASIQFQVLGGPGTSSALTFTSASINEDGIPVLLDPGLFTVTCAGSPNGTSCNDGNACTASDACQAGACAGGVVLQVPSEIGNVKFGTNHSTITWDSAAPAGPGTVHDVVRGFENGLPVGTGPGESCFATGIAAATVSDASTPPASSAYWYLVRGRNACGIGSYGFRGINGAPGAERTTSTCP